MLCHIIYGALDIGIVDEYGIKSTVSVDCKEIISWNKEKKEGTYQSSDYRIKKQWTTEIGIYRVAAMLVGTTQRAFLGSCLSQW